MPLKWTPCEPVTYIYIAARARVLTVKITVALTEFLDEKEIDKGV